MRKLVLGLVCVLVGLLFSAESVFVFGTNKFEKEEEKEKSAVKLAREVARGGYDLVTTQELKKWMDEKREMVVVDTMPYEASYKKAHVPGAAQFLFPIAEMKGWDVAETGGKSRAEYEALLGADKSKAVVIYCGFVKCTRSHNGALWAKKLGYKRVYRYSGGIYAWKGAGHSVESIK